MTPAAGLDAAAGDLQELSGVLRRAVSLDPDGLVRVRVIAPTISALVRLPFGVLVARTVELAHGADSPIDTTVSAASLVAWLDGEADDPPAARDAEWLSGLPPTAGWRRIDIVPGDVVRGLVRSGASALKQAAGREGVPFAQPRSEVADALLDTVVLTVAGDGTTVELTLRSLSALVRMGFLPRESHIAVDVAGRWIRVAAAYGSVYAERPGFGLGMLRR